MENRISLLFEAFKLLRLRLTWSLSLFLFITKRIWRLLTNSALKINSSPVRDNFSVFYFLISIQNQFQSLVKSVGAC